MAKTSENREVRDTLKAMALISGRDLTEFAVVMILRDLDQYPPEKVLLALHKYRHERPGFPSLSDIICRIDDGRPGPEEAWALVPKDECSSAVWTDEMRDAFSVVRELLADDPIAARKSFLEVYQRLLADSRLQKKPIRWTPTLGLDRAGQSRVIKEAVSRGRLSDEHARRLIGDESAPMPMKQISGHSPGELGRIDPSKYLNEIRKMITGEGAT